MPQLETATDNSPTPSLKEQAQHLASVAPPTDKQTTGESQWLDAIQPLPPYKRGIRYGLAVGVVILAMLLKFLQNWFVMAGTGEPGHTLTSASGTPFLTFYVAVIVAAWFGGLGPGIAATALSGLISCYLFIEPVFSFNVTGIGAVTNLVLFGLAGGLISLLGQRLQSTLRRAWAQADINRRLAASLEQERARFEVTLASIGDGVIATDSQGRVTFINPVASELTGWPADQAQSQPLTEIFRIVNETNRQPVANPAARVLKEGTVIGLANHTVLVGKNGREIPIDDSAAPIRDPQTGQLSGAVLVFRDITLRRKNEQNQLFLQEATIALSSSLDYQTTLNTVARLAVPTIADWCSVYMPQVSPQDGAVAIEQVAVAHPDPAKAELAREFRQRYPLNLADSGGVPAVLRTGQPEIVNHLNLKALEVTGPAREQVDFLDQIGVCGWLTVPMRAGEQILGAINLISTDLQHEFGQTELELAQELARRAALAIENARLYRQAEEAVGLRNQFLAVAAHELKTPLTSLKGYSQILSRQLKRGITPDPQRVEQALGAINQQTDKLNLLITQLLDISRLEAGRMKLERQPIEVVELVREVVERASATQTTPEKHSLSLTAEPPAIEIWLDGVRFEQVVTNLVNNAIKYSPAGGPIRVDLGVVTHPVLLAETSQPDLDLPVPPGVKAEELTYLRLTVTDRGIGIPPEKRSRIFEQFYQAHAHEYTSGMGLGLYISQEIIRLHGGRIWVEFPAEGGTQFVVAVPCYKT